jgi:hypothetical protein
LWIQNVGSCCENSEIHPFDDVDNDLGYEYRGQNFSVQNDRDVFFIGTHDDESGGATVVSQTTMHTNGNLRQLVIFSQTELVVSRIWL